MFAKYPNILHSEKWLGTWSPWFLAVLLHPSSITQKKTHPYLFPHDSLVYFAPYFAPQAPFSFFEMVLSTGHCPNCSSLSQVISFITRFITFHNCILFTCNPVFMSYHLFCARWKKKSPIKILHWISGYYIFLHWEKCLLTSKENCNSICSFFTTELLGLAHCLSQEKPCFLDSGHTVLLHCPIQ